MDKQVAYVQLESVAKKTYVEGPAVSSDIKAVQYSTELPCHIRREDPGTL